MNKLTALTVAFCPVLAFAQQVGGQEAFVKQQAFAEMQRVSGQVDVLQNNFEALEQRVGKIEGNGEAKSLRVEIDALKNAVAELRREIAAQRGEIVKDLTGRISKMQKDLTPPAPPPPPPPKPKVIPPHKEYVVTSGDTLSLISQAFGTTVAKIREMNGLKSDNLRVGQKLMIPKN